MEGNFCWCCRCYMTHEYCVFQERCTCNNVNRYTCSILFVYHETVHIHRNSNLLCVWILPTPFLEQRDNWWITYHQHKKTWMELSTPVLERMPYLYEANSTDTVLCTVILGYSVAFIICRCAWKGVLHYCTNTCMSSYALAGCYLWLPRCTFPRALRNRCFV